jgi:hypothetical protein
MENIVGGFKINPESQVKCDCCLEFVEVYTSLGSLDCCPKPKCKELVLESHNSCIEFLDIRFQGKYNTLPRVNVERCNEIHQMENKDVFAVLSTIVGGIFNRNSEISCMNDIQYFNLVTILAVSIGDILITNESEFIEREVRGHRRVRNAIITIQRGFRKWRASKSISS